MKNHALKARKLSEKKWLSKSASWQEDSDHRAMRDMPDKERKQMSRDYFAAEKPISKDKK